MTVASLASGAPSGWTVGRGGGASTCQRLWPRATQAATPRNGIG